MHRGHFDSTVSESSLIDDWASSESSVFGVPIAPCVLMFLICSLFTQRSNPSGRFRCGTAVVRACRPPLQRQHKTEMSGEGRDLIRTDCHRKIPVKTPLCQFFFVFRHHFKTLFCLPWVAVAVPECLSGIFSVQPVPAPAHPPHPTGAEVRCDPTADQLLVCYLLLSFSLRAQQWGKSLAFSWPLLDQGRLKDGGQGYVSSLSGLLTGFPPFITTGSLVVLLEGGPPASLGTASPTSCNEGSRYIATRWEEEKGKVGWWTGWLGRRRMEWEENLCY